MATESEIHAWIAGYVRDFDQLCQALMWQLANKFGSVVSTPPSAIAAYRTERDAGRIQQGTPPPGSFVYYEIGTYGHDGFMMDNGHVFMGTTKLVEEWSQWNAGWNTYDGYAAATGARYLGWSWQNGGNTVPFTSGSGGGGGGGSTDYAYGLSTDCQRALQDAMSKQNPSRYTGPIDGEFGKQSVMGMQQWLIDLGYLPADYKVDGIPGKKYGTALQELARDRGVPPYTGPIDGAPGANTSTSLIGWAATTIPGPPDPGPEPGPEPVVPATPTGTWFGVDVGTSQAGMDFAAFAAAGGKSVIVKAGGANAGDSPYVAPEYTSQLPAARAAGLEVGHYWFNGNKNGLTPTSSAQFFIENIDLQEGDVVALDVEAETSTGTVAYTPAEVLEFVTEVDRLRPGVKVLIYMSASVVRSGEWDPVVAAGHPLWVAMYGANDATIPADPPEIDDWSDWAVWQYSSTVVVPGFGGSIDANIVRDDTWTKYGYVLVVDPGPEPGPGPDPALASILEAYFGELAALNARYQTLVEELPGLVAGPGTASRTGIGRAPASLAPR